MLDIMRALTEGRGGRFEVTDRDTLTMKFIGDLKRPKRIIPYSLDGLPLVPKPINKLVDSRFKPSNEDLLYLRTYLRRHVNKGLDVENHDFLVKAMARISAHQYLKLRADVWCTASIDKIIKIAQNWLKDENYSHPSIMPRDNQPQATIKSFIGMATGTASVSLDYCIGQVWRHCQPTLYRIFSFTDLPGEVIDSVVQLNERLKRYSFGPPVASLQQLLALIDAGLISLKVVDDPKIDLTESGWKFFEDGDTVYADTMINTVLDPPELNSVSTPIVQNLLKDGMIQSVGKNLGVCVHPNGLVKTPKDRPQVPLAILGRLAKGSVLGVDTLKECFGPVIKQWARDAVYRFDGKIKGSTSCIKATAVG